MFRQFDSLVMFEFFDASRDDFTVSVVVFTVVEDDVGDIRRFFDLAWRDHVPNAHEIWSVAVDADSSAFSAACTPGFLLEL